MSIHTSYLIISLEQEQEQEQEQREQPKSAMRIHPLIGKSKSHFTFHMQRAIRFSIVVSQCRAALVWPNSLEEAQK